MFERYDAPSVLDAIEGACPQAASLITEGQDALRGAPERLEALRRAATLFELPVPLEVLEKLRAAVGGDVGRLPALGLCDRFEDVAAPPRPAAAVNALARPRAAELSEDEAKALAGLLLDELFRLWGAADGRRRPYPAAAELTRLALLSENAPVLAACAADALYWLDEQVVYRRATGWAQRIVASLDGAGIQPSPVLLRLAGEACVRVGEPQPAGAYYARALVRIEAQLASGRRRSASSAKSWGRSSWRAESARKDGRCCGGPRRGFRRMRRDGEAEQVAQLIQRIEEGGRAGRSHGCGT